MKFETILTAYGISTFRKAKLIAKKNLQADYPQIKRLIRQSSAFRARLIKIHRRAEGGRDG